MAAAALAWIAVALHGFSGDVSISRERLPATVPKLLPAGQNMLDAPQVTLVRYSQGVSRGAAVLFTAARPRAGVVRDAATQRLAGLATLDQTSTCRRWCIRSDRIAVAHVALIDPTAVGPLVGNLGGVNVTNPTPFTATANGRSYTFGHGRLHLDDARAAAFAHVATSQEPLELASVSLLAASFTGCCSRPRSSGCGQSAARWPAPPRPISATPTCWGWSSCGCAAARRCSAWFPAALATAPPAVDVLARAAGDRPATAGGGCRMRSIPSAAVTPPLVVVRLAQRYGWSGFAAGSGAALLLAVACAGLLWWRWPRQRRQVSIWPPLQVPADGADVVWSQQPPAAADSPAPTPAAADQPAQEQAEPSRRPSATATAIAGEPPCRRGPAPRRHAARATAARADGCGRAPP